MQIQSITAKNFKSLVDFRLELAKFTCLVGLNGAGKSTVLQFLDFIGQLVRGNFDRWLAERGWEATDLRSKFASRSTIEFSVRCTSESGVTITWEGSFDSSKLFCTSEWIRIGSLESLEVRDGLLRISETTASNSVRPVAEEKIKFSYQGSVLSQLKHDILPAGISDFATRLQSLQSPDLLSPERLRQRNRDAADFIGLGGGRLSALLHQIGRDKRRLLARRLKFVYHQLESIDSFEESGWRQLAIEEHYGDQLLRTEARHMNDGMIRLIAIMVELDSDARFLLFDEIENGTNPEVVEMLVRSLSSAKQQVVATTHSPMILNYLDDAAARAGVMYVYKTRLGHSRAIPFFSISSLEKKLAVMGPGEAFADTNLTELANEISELTGASV
jgi:ABC-type lipoprotein export system ATPase subunit